MVKFIIQGQDNPQSYWDECLTGDNLYISIKNYIRYSKVTFDAHPMLIHHDLALDCTEALLATYLEYSKKTNLPSKSFSCVGGSTSLSFMVRKEDATCFAEALHDFIYPFILSNRITIA